MLSVLVADFLGREEFDRGTEGITDGEMLKDRAQALIHAHPAFDCRGKRRENPSGYIVETMQAVFQAFFASDSFEGCLLDVVNRGGDADTTGAIAGMLAGARYGLEAIPRRWLKALDSRVRDACEAQALALLSVARCPSVDFSVKSTPKIDVVQYAGTRCLPAARQT